MGEEGMRGACRGVREERGVAYRGVAYREPKSLCIASLRIASLRIASLCKSPHLGGRADPHLGRQLSLVVIEELA
jgi:hypothetical protein